jgi:hypothetical protein
MLRRQSSAKLSAGRRLRVNWRAKITAGTSRTECTVINISHTGACLSLGNVTDNVPLWLTVDRKSPIPATIVWRKRDCVGLRFRKEQTWVDDTSDQRFDPAAWLRDAPNSED